MVIFVLYLNQDISDSVAEYALSRSFDGKKIKYEKRMLGGGNGYFVEIDIFAEEETCLTAGVYNNLLLALRVVEFIEGDILINDESDDPYQWIRIDKEKNVRIVEEIDEEDTEAVLISDELGKKVDLQYALTLLPDKEYILLPQNKRPAYYVRDSSFWLK